MPSDEGWVKTTIAPVSDPPKPTNSKRQSFFKNLFFLEKSRSEDEIPDPNPERKSFPIFKCTYGEFKKGLKEGVSEFIKGFGR